MQITPAINPLVARAYGLVRQPSAGAGLPQAARSPAAAPSGQVRDLVAGSVSRPVDFNGLPPASAAGVHQLYTRAADKVEAAVAVQVGRTIDVRG